MVRRVPTCIPKRCVDVFRLGLGLKATIETIDNRSDFKTYMQNYVYARGTAAPKGPRREGPPEEGFVRSHYCLIQGQNNLGCHSFHHYQCTTPRFIALLQLPSYPAVHLLALQRPAHQRIPALSLTLLSMSIPPTILPTPLLPPNNQIKQFNLVSME